MSLGDLMRIVRKELQLTQEDLAIEINLSYATLNRWANCKVKPSQYGLMQLRDYCVENNMAEEIIAELNRLIEISPVIKRPVRTIRKEAVY